MTRLTEEQLAEGFDFDLYEKIYELSRDIPNLSEGLIAGFRSIANNIKSHTEEMRKSATDEQIARFYSFAGFLVENYIQKIQPVSENVKFYETPEYIAQQDDAKKLYYEHNRLLGLQPQ